MFGLCLWFPARPRSGPPAASNDAARSSPGIAAVAARRRARSKNSPISAPRRRGKFLEGRLVRQKTAILVRGDWHGVDSYLTPDGKLVPVVNCNPPAELGQTCEPQGSRFLNGKLYLTTGTAAILVYDPATKELKTLVYTYKNQLFKGPNDLDFDAEGNLFFHRSLGDGPGPNASDRHRRSVTNIRRTASCAR